MSSKYLEMSPPVSAAIRAGTPVVAIETGYFMRLPYPRNLKALQDCEQILWSRDCVPCSLAVLDGRLRAGLTRADMETVCKAGVAASRVDLPAMVGSRGTAALRPSAALAVAKMAGVEPVVVPGLSDSLADLDALCSCRRLAFCAPIPTDKKLLYASRGIPVTALEGDALADAYLIQKELEVTESTVVPCESNIGVMAEAAAAAAIAVKRKSA